MDLKDPFVTLENDKRVIKMNKTPHRKHPSRKIMNMVKKYINNVEIGISRCKLLVYKGVWARRKARIGECN